MTGPQNARNLTNDPESSVGRLGFVAGRPVLQQALGLGGSKVLAAILSAAWLIVAARSLPMRQFADLLLLLALGLMLAAFADCGLPLLLVAGIAQDPGLAREGVRQVIAKRLLLGVGAVALLGALWLPLASKPSPTVVLLFGVSILATAIHTTIFAALRGLGQVAPEAVNEAVSRACVLTLGSVLLVGGGGLISAVVPYAIADLTSAGVALLLAGRHLPASNGEPTNLTLRRSMPIASTNLLASLYYRVDVWLLAILANPRSVALYAASYRVFEGLVLPAVAIGAVALASTPRLAPERQRTRLLKLTALAVGLAAIGGIPLAVLADVVLKRVFGPAFGDAETVLRLLILAVIPTAVVGALGSFALVAFPERVRRLIFGCLVLVTLLNLIAIPLWGALGAAGTTIACQSLLAGGLAHLVFRRRPLKHNGGVAGEETPRRDTRGDWYLAQAPRDVVSESVMAWLDERAGVTVLDLGCGTGGYGAELARRGRVVVAADVDPRYVEAALSLGVPAVLVGTACPLPFPDGAVDTVILVEVLEHLEDPEIVLWEALRVTRSRLLVTVPDCSYVDSLREFGLTFEHMLEVDHRRFFTNETLRALLQRRGWKLNVQPGDHVDVGLARLHGGRVLAKLSALAIRAGLRQPKISARLFAELERIDVQLDPSTSSGP